MEPWEWIAEMGSSSDAASFEIPDAISIPSWFVRVPHSMWVRTTQSPPSEYEWTIVNLTSAVDHHQTANDTVPSGKLT